MIHKTKLMPFLLIGISMLNVTFFSCKKLVDYEVTCNYYYLNKSNMDLKMKVFNNEKLLLHEYPILLDDTLLIELVGVGGVGPFRYDTYEDKIGDSVSIIFSDNKTLGFNLGEDPLYEKNYSIEKFGNTKRKLEYIFSDSDYANAN